MSRLLPAACILKGDRVRLTEEGAEPREVTVLRVHNADPDPGRIRWETDGGDVHVGGSTRVEVALLGA